jgi:HK97 family phage prohead protease
MIERRNIITDNTEETETRAEAQADGTKYIMGYAALVNSASRPITENINGRNVTFIEKIDQRAFDNAVIDDIVYLIDHDPSKLVGRQGANLEVKKTDRGLFFKNKVIDTTISRDLYTAIQERLYKENSFAFKVQKDEWYKVDGQLHRNIKEIAQVVDISTTIKGVYAEPFIFTRSLNEEEIKEIVQEQTIEVVISETEKDSVDIEFLRLKSKQF